MSASRAGGAYETPGGTIMLRAHRAIESLTLDREVAHLKDDLMPRYATMVYNGYWWSPERELLQQTIDATQEVVNGTVRVKLYKGNVDVVGRRSPDSLFDEAIATFEDDGGAYDQADAEGFIKLNALAPPHPGGQAGHCMTADSETLWHGRFEGGPAEALLAYTVSLPYDQRLAQHDVEGSRAHARGLRRAGLLDDGELAAILAALDTTVGRRTRFRLLRAGLRPSPTRTSTPPWSGVSPNSPARSRRPSCTPARSRNDQVATDHPALVQAGTHLAEVARALSSPSSEVLLQRAREADAE